MSWTSFISIADTLLTGAVIWILISAIVGLLYIAAAIRWGHCAHDWVCHFKDIPGETDKIHVTRHCTYCGKSVVETIPTTPPFSAVDKTNIN